jgi:hypothetical protein
MLRPRFVLRSVPFSEPMSFVVLLVALFLLASFRPANSVIAQGDDNCFELSRSGIDAWWRADGNAIDEVDGHDGQMQDDAGFAAGKIGQAFSLDGKGDWIRIPDSNAWAFGTGDFTIDAWIYMNAGHSGDLTIAGQTEDLNNWWRFGITSAGRLRFQATSGGGPPEVSVGSVVDSFADEVWHHVAVTRTGLTTWAFYHDGEYLPPAHPADIGVVVLDGAVPNLASPLALGQSIIGLYLDGRLDEVEILKGTALSDEDVASIYESGKCGDERIEQDDEDEEGERVEVRPNVGGAIAAFPGAAEAARTNRARAAAAASTLAPSPPPAAAIRPPSTGDAGLVKSLP